MSDDWMNGVCSNMQDSIYGKRKDVLLRELRAALKDWRKLLPDSATQEELAKYLEALSPRHRELFLEAGRFVGMLYNELDSYPEHLQDTLAVVMMFSLIERLQASGPKFLRLQDWMLGEECAQTFGGLASSLNTKVKMQSLLKAYFAKHGSKQAALEFIERYFSDEGKRFLVRSHCTQKPCIIGVSRRILERLVPKFSDSMSPQDVKRILGDRVELGHWFLPECYHVTCYVDGGQCHPNLDCRLDTPEILEKTLAKAIGTLIYDHRNAFVHKARLTILAQRITEDAQAYSSIAFVTLDDKTVKTTLDRNSLLCAFKPALLSSFDRNRTCSSQPSN